MRLLASTALAPIAWGTTYATATELLPAGRPLLAAALRTLPAALLLLAVVGRLPRGAWWWRAPLLGSLNVGVFFVLLFVAADRLPGGVAALLGALTPLVVLGLAWRVLGTRPHPRQVVAALVALGGVALLVGAASVALDPLGVAAGLGGSASVATGIVLAKRWPLPARAAGRGGAGLTLAAWQLASAAVLLVPLALVVEGPPPALSTAALGGAAHLTLLGTALAYWVWFRGLAELQPARVAFLALLSPVVATALGVAVVGETLAPAQVAGAALVVGGVVAGATVGPVAARQDQGAAKGCPGGCVP